MVHGLAKRNATAGAKRRSAGCSLFAQGIAPGEEQSLRLPHRVVRLRKLRNAHAAPITLLSTSDQFKPERYPIPPSCDDVVRSQ